MAKNTNAVAMESPVNMRKQTIRNKKMNNKPKKQIASATDIRYFYPQSWSDYGNKRGFIEYIMSPEMISDLLGSRESKYSKVDPQKYLCDYVNDQMNLMGYCVRVIAG